MHSNRKKGKSKNHLTYFVDSNGFLDLLLSEFLSRRARDSPVGFVSWTLAAYLYQIMVSCLSILLVVLPSIGFDNCMHHKLLFNYLLQNRLEKFGIVFFFKPTTSYIRCCCRSYSDKRYKTEFFNIELSSLLFKPLGLFSWYTACSSIIAYFRSSKAL
jgi:hypothetical protein